MLGKEVNSRDRLARKEEIESKLQMELVGLTMLKDTLQRSNNLTKGMTGILISFEDRLAKLEETILPVYHDTSSLQRRQENIDKTLDALDHIINYYNVTKEVEQTVKEGVVDSSDQYLKSIACVQHAIACVQHAIAYFEKNNPESPELHNLKMLFILGSEALEKHFRDLLNRYCKPMPPILILDIIEELAVDSDRVLNEQLQEKALKELICIASWLTKHDRDDHLTVYATIRSNILLRSLQGFRDFQKSSSGGRGSVMSASAVTLVAHGSPALNRSRLKETPTRKTSKRLQQVLMKKATSTVIKYSQSVEHATGIPLGHRRQGSFFELRDENIDLDVEYYLSSITALCKLMQCELKLMNQIIPKHHWKLIFERIYQASLEMIIQEGENIATRAKKCASKHDFLSTLMIFPILKHLKTLKPEFETILPESREDIISKLNLFIYTLSGTGIKSLEDFMESIKNDLDRQMPKDGTVHELTSNAMIFLEQLKDYGETVGSVFVDDPTFRAHLVNLPERDRSMVALAVYIVRVLSALGLTLMSKCEWYNDPYLKAVFRLNNLHYILKTLQRSGILDITKLSSPEVELHYTDQILEAKRLYSQSWSRVMHYVTEVDRPLAISPGQQKLKEKDKQNIKDKFTGFNKEMEDIFKIQKGYAIPDVELRESLKRENKEYILPNYHRFFEKYNDMAFTKHKEKYIRYTPTVVSDMIDNFFDVAA